MVIFAAKFIYGTTLELRSRVVLIPWVKKNLVISCSKVRACSSSFPVRYIPKTKKSSETNDLQASSPPVKGLEDKEMHKVSDPNELRGEFSNGGKSIGRSIVLDDKSQNKNRNQGPSNSLIFKVKSEVGEDIVHNWAVEDYKFMEEKSSKTKGLQDSSLPVKGSKEKEMHKGSDPNVLRVEFSNGGKGIGRSLVLDDNSRNKIRNQRPSNSLIFNSRSEVEEDIDYNVAVEDYEFMEEPEEAGQVLGIHQGKDAREQIAFRAGRTKEDVENIAIELLAKRAFTAVELKKKLLRKRCPCDIVDAVITDFQSRGLINDCFYAESFSRSRWHSSSWGPRRIKQALFNKGVTEVDAGKAVKLVFEDGESGGDQESTLGMSKLSMDRLFVQASKQWQRSRDVPTETRKSRIIRWLQYRGFNWGVISFVLKKLESVHPP